MKIIYMGTPDFAVPTLEKLIENHEVVLVITNPDKPKGRSKKLQFSPVKEVAVKNNIEVYQPIKARDKECIEKIRKVGADLMVVCAYGQILPEEMLGIPKYGTINVHGSLLPKYRGAAPIQWAVINGEKETGVTIMRVVKKLDAGAILSKRSIKLSKDETGESLFDKLSILGGELLLDTIDSLEKGSIVETPQDESGATYASMLSKEMGNIDWNKSASEIECLIRGLYSWPGSYSFIQDKMYKIHKVKVCEEEISDLGKCPGDIYKTKTRLFVRCKEGILEILKIQPVGKKAMDTESFLRGYDIEGKFERVFNPFDKHMIL